MLDTTGASVAAQRGYGHGDRPVMAISMYDASVPRLANILGNP